MKIVIVGAGFTGTQLARRLINEKNEVTLVDTNQEILDHATNNLDCSVVLSDGNTLETLESAGISKADALVCVTSNDEVNMITCSLVDAIYPHVLKIARVRNFAYYLDTEKVQKKQAEFTTEKQRPLYGIDYMIHPDIEAAQAIVQAVESGAVSDVVTFENSEYELTRIAIQKESRFAGATLADLRSMTDIPFLISYVESHGFPMLPSGKTILEVGDYIGVLTKKGDIGAILELTGTEVESIDKIALVGAGKIGTLIAERLLANKKKKSFLLRLFGKSKIVNSNFAIVDSDRKLANEAAEKFPEAKVYVGDITDENFLYEESLTTYDLVICATSNHELNMVGAAYLESLGVGKTVSLVESAPFAAIARKLGVDVPVPLRDAVVDSILSHLRGKTITGIHTVSSGSLEIIEFSIPMSAKIVGKTLLEISNPGTFLVLLIKKAGTDNYIIPTGSTSIDSNDQMIIIADADKSKKLMSSFGVK